MSRDARDLLGRSGLPKYHCGDVVEFRLHRHRLTKILTGVLVKAEVGAYDDNFIPSYVVRFCNPMYGDLEDMSYILETHIIKKRE